MDTSRMAQISNRPSSGSAIGSQAKTTADTLPMPTSSSSEPIGEGDPFGVTTSARKGRKVRMTLNTAPR